jgi:hypothetical protein
MLLTQDRCFRCKSFRPAHLDAKVAEYRQSDEAKSATGRFVLLISDLSTYK